MCAPAPGAHRTPQVQGRSLLRHKLWLLPAKACAPGPGPPQASGGYSSGSARSPLPCSVAGSGISSGWVASSHASTCWRSSSVLSTNSPTSPSLMPPTRRYCDSWRFARHASKVSGQIGGALPQHDRQGREREGVMLRAPGPVPGARQHEGPQSQSSTVGRGKAQIRRDRRHRGIGQAAVHQLQQLLHLAPRGAMPVKPPALQPVAQAHPALP